MNQYGLKPSGSSAIIDQLSYTYKANNNKLTKVTDLAPSTVTDQLGDFQDGVNSGDDYAYDGNGNLISDQTGKISSIRYNILNLPSEIQVAGKGSIKYYYDATGNKLQKRTLDNTLSTTSPTVTSYIGGAVYLNDTLQFFGTPEGRVRIDTVIKGWVYDYYLSDHLGNTRMMLTDDYNVATPILEAYSYYPFGLQQKGIGMKLPTSQLHNKYTYNGKELQEDLGLDQYDYGARFYNAQIGRWGTVDPLASDLEDWSMYNYSVNNPLRFIDPNGMAPEDIIIGGKNNSSITIKTDLIDISVDGSSLVGDFGGNYTLQGNDILIAALDIVGVIEPTPFADLTAATLEANQGNWFSAASSALGVIPYLGDLAKVGKIGKDVKAIKNAIKAVNGNSKASKKAQHVYEIFEKGTDNVVKTGISGGKVSKTDKSYRATRQVNKWNKAEGKSKYDSRIVDKIPAGKGARQEALRKEKINAEKLRKDGHLQDKDYHQRP